MKNRLSSNLLFGLAAATFLAMPAIAQEAAPAAEAPATASAAEAPAQAAPAPAPVAEQPKAEESKTEQAAAEQPKAEEQAAAPAENTNPGEVAAAAGNAFDMLKASMSEETSAANMEVKFSGEVEFVLRGHIEDYSSLLGGEELPVGPQELEGVPLPWIVGGCDDDASVRPGEGDGHLSGRSRGEAYLYYVHPAGCQSSDDEVLDHLSGDPRVPSDDHLVPGPFRGRRLPLGKCGAVSVDEPYYINRRKPVSGLSSNGSADAGNRFDEGHR